MARRAPQSRAVIEPELQVARPSSHQPLSPGHLFSDVLSVDRPVGLARADSWLITDSLAQKYATQPEYEVGDGAADREARRVGLLAVQAVDPIQLRWCAGRLLPDPLPRKEGLD